MSRDKCVTRDSAARCGDSRVQNSGRKNYRVRVTLHMMPVFSRTRKSRMLFMLHLLTIPMTIVMRGGDHKVD